MRRTMPDHAPLQLEHFLPYRLSILSNTISQAIAREYQQRFHLGMTEWRVLAVLARYDGAGLSARELAARTATDKVAISRALARLIASGRVLRRTHHGDKRRSVLRLSAKGWAIHAVVAPRARAHERELLARLDADERACLTRILDKLLGSVPGAIAAAPEPLISARGMAPPVTAPSRMRG
ncbi:MarR family winged helix-turn-helix transcriptional regulator [Metallibacterium scheffleri]